MVGKSFIFLFFFKFMEGGTDHQNNQFLFYLKLLSRKSKSHISRLSINPLIVSHFIFSSHFVTLKKLITNSNKVFRIQKKVTSKKKGI